MSGTPPSKGSNASNFPSATSQQRMLQVQMQQQQMKMLHQQKSSSPSSSSSSQHRGSVVGGPNNPLAPAPARGSVTGSSASGSVGGSSTTTLVKSSKSKGGTKQTATAIGRGSLSGALPLPTTFNSTSSMGGPGSSIPHSFPSSEEMNRQLLSKCDWKDKTIWVARQLLGGNATNGFLRATASVQRIKRQRARQTAQSKQKQAAKETDSAAAAAASASSSKDKDKDSANKDKEKDAKDNNNKDTKVASTTSAATTATGTTTTTTTATGKKREAPDQESEEILKKEVMNPRTAKKLRAELQGGLNWCIFLQNTIRNILYEMDPEIAKHTPLPLIQGGEIPKVEPLPPPTTATNPKGNNNSNPQQVQSSSSLSNISSSSQLPSAPPSLAKAHPDALPASASMQTQKQQQRRGSEKTGASGAASRAAGASNKEGSTTGGSGGGGGGQASPGGESGSTLRKNRKKKLPPCTEAVVELSEFDAAGKKFSRKEHFFRIFECTRFRALKIGDFVAARVSSRDLWILARVQKDYPGFTMPPTEFLKLSEARRDAQFKGKVAIKDVEDKEGGITMVQRGLILPLPRTFSEAADWAYRSMKKSRVYAMYPNTTSLYSATVVDNSTYCRGDDDILVVEFDGDEAESGLLPKYHIPARFVTLIPREFPAAQTNSKKRKSATATILPSAAADLASPASVKSIKSEGSLGLDDGLGGMVNTMGLDDLVTTDSLEDFGFDFSEEA